MGGGPPGFPQGFSCPVVLWILLPIARFRIRGFHPLWPAFPKPFCYRLIMASAVRNPDPPKGVGLASFPFARRYLGNHSCFLLLSLLRCFNSRRFPAYRYLIHHTLTEVRSVGLPHSDTHGSLVFCTFPWLFAALCVLLRLLVPRHSPFALIRLTGPDTHPYM